MIFMPNKKKLAASLWHAVASGNWDLIERAYEPDVAYHGCIELQGRDELIKLARSYNEAFPDLTLVSRHHVAKGDLVATRIVATGTHTGPLMGLRPTGARLEVAIVNTVRVVKGRVVEEWESFEHPSFLQQLGIIPA